MLLAYITASCVNELPLSFTEQEAELAVVARFSDRDTVHNVYLTISSGDDLSCPTAESLAQVWKDGKCVAQTDTIRFSDSEPWIQNHQLRFHIEHGCEYTLKVTSGDFNAVSVAEAIIPYRGTASVEDSLSIRDEQGFRKFQSIQIQVSDEKDVDSYYMLDDHLDGIVRYWKGDNVVDSCRVERLGKIHQPPSIHGIASELGMEVQSSFSGMFVFSDYSFKNKSFYITADFNERPLYISSWGRYTMHDTYDKITVAAIIRVGVVTEREYGYLRLLNTDSGLIISEPIMLPNNVTGGYGDFGIVSTADVFVDLGR